MQGVCDTTTGAPLVLFELPPCTSADAGPGPAIQVTQLLSFLSFGTFEAAVKGLSAFPPDQWPPTVITFLAYHNMVVLGSLMALLILFGAVYLWRGSVTRHRTWLRLAVFAPLLPFAAIQLGWATAEIGRQPWIVYGLMRTDAGVSTAVGATDILLTTGLLAAIYVLLLTLWLRLMRKEILHGPADDSVPEGVLDRTSAGAGSPAPAGLSPRGA
jgi:cytochrome d ubiquinol oxidase subunit I